jgi:hypothetical protein
MCPTAFGLKQVWIRDDPRNARSKHGSPRSASTLSIFVAGHGITSGGRYGYKSIISGMRITVGRRERPHAHPRKVAESSPTRTARIGGRGWWGGLVVPAMLSADWGQGKTQPHRSIAHHVTGQSVIHAANLASLSQVLKSPRTATSDPHHGLSDKLLFQPNPPALDPLSRLRNRTFCPRAHNVCPAHAGHPVNSR